MLHKVEKFISIGKFRNYTASGDVCFRKLTLFYGDNGAGKSTLTAIIRSLSQNKPDMVEKRISTNHALTQEAQIIQRIIRGEGTAQDIYHTFRTGGWSNPFPDIEIFDAHFVSDNVYSGFDFSDDHKKQLYEFVIGAQGVAIKQAIEQNKNDKAILRQSQVTLESNIIQQVGNGLTGDSIASFQSISESEIHDVDAKIISARAALNSAKATATLNTLAALSHISAINSGIDFTGIIADLQSTMQTIQDAALKTLFENHCIDLGENLVEDPVNWLQTGFSYVQSKQKATSLASGALLACPFCQKPIDTSIEIIKAYALSFDSVFNALISRLQTYLTSVYGFNLEANFHILNDTILKNEERIALWRQHIHSSVTEPTYNESLDIATLKGQFQHVIESLKSKVQNPSAPVASSPATTFQTSLESINTNIATYNQNVDIYNNAIAELRSGIKTEQQAQAELDRLNRIKKRFDTSIMVLCEQLSTEKAALRDLENSYTQLVQQQEQAATALFTNYKDRINYYLDTVFKTPFKIDSVTHIPPQGRATQSKIQYRLTIDGIGISFEPDEPLSVEYCLSEGDKNTIALALFLSKLDIDPAKGNKIIIFDDPLSSFDRNRRLYTVQLIKSLLTQVKQIVVLSHSEYFLYELTKGIAPGDKKTLVITENPIAKESKIEPLDLDALVEIEYFRHIKELEDFLSSPDINKKERVLGLMRNVLEAHMRFKFYRQTIGIPSNNRTFGNLINELVRQNVIFRDDTTPPSVISKLRLINDISIPPHHGEPIPDYGTLGVDPNTMTVVELGNFVRDTLDLIDNRL